MKETKEIRVLQAANDMFEEKRNYNTS